MTFLTITTGVFFVLTGMRKSFVPAARTGVFNLFDSHKVPRVLQGALIVGELAGGLGLLASLLPIWNPLFRPVVALGLQAIMAGAYLLDTLPAVIAKQAGKPASYSRFLSNAICTPEAQLIFILMAIATGW